MLNLSMPLAVPWIEGGWVTAVTGEGRLCTHSKCIRALLELKRSGVVADFYSQNGNGAIFVQLNP